MALTNTLRMAASRAPLAAHFFRGALFAPRIHVSSVLCYPRFPSAVRSFSPRPALDECLLQLLQDNITRLEKLDKAILKKFDEEIKKAKSLEDFPFEIIDRPGQQNVTLAREYKGERVTAQVRKLTFDGKKPEPSHIPTVVRISRNDGAYLEFGFTLSPKNFTLNRLCVKNPNSDVEQISFEEFYLQNLDNNLVIAILQYLEIRGITDKTVSFLRVLTRNKDRRECLMWLKNIKRFVEA